MSQEEFAQLIGVSKPTVARIETLEVPMRLDVYTYMLKQLSELGIVVDALHADKVKIEISDPGLAHLMLRLADEKNRRSDKRSTIKISVPNIMSRLTEAQRDALVKSLESGDLLRSMASKKKTDG